MMTLHLTDRMGSVRSFSIDTMMETVTDGHGDGKCNKAFNFLVYRTHLHHKLSLRMILHLVTVSRHNVRIHNSA